MGELTWRQQQSVAPCLPPNNLLAAALPPFLPCHPPPQRFLDTLLASARVEVFMPGEVAGGPPRNCLTGHQITPQGCGHHQHC